MKKKPITRRVFIKQTAGLAAGTPLLMTAVPLISTNSVRAKMPEESRSMDDLLQAIEDSDVSKASKLFQQKIEQGADPWEIHLALFPVIQRVLNPPFINPHFPKMHGICRELLPYLGNEEIAALVHLEVTGCARRPKLKSLPVVKLPASNVSFVEIESAIADDNPVKATALIAAFHNQQGTDNLFRHLLLLGSSYLDDTLGHSISCTAYILLEMMVRNDQNPWPAMATLADYYCKGRFQNMPELEKADTVIKARNLENYLWKATSGKGIVNLHHTITFYTLEQVRRFLNKNEYEHALSACVAFMGEKEKEPIRFENASASLTRNYTAFKKAFSSLDAKAVVGSLQKMIPSSKGRRQLGRFLVRAVCETIKGDYNPHDFTGLGSALWVVNNYWNEPVLAMNSLYQYLDYFFDGIKT
jgi:hypothetical protein